MTSATIDHTALADKARSGELRDVRVVGLRGGWHVVVQLDKASLHVLTAQRRRQPRLFRKMDTVRAYLSDMGISKFQVDATAFAPESYNRADRSSAMKLTHQAAAHDAWFRNQVREALLKADAPDAVWIANEDAKDDWARQRADLLARTGDKV